MEVMKLEHVRSKMVRLRLMRMSWFGEMGPLMFAWRNTKRQVDDPKVGTFRPVSEVQYGTYMNPTCLIFDASCPQHAPRHSSL